MSKQHSKDSENSSINFINDAYSDFKNQIKSKKISLDQIDSICIALISSFHMVKCFKSEQDKKDFLKPTLALSTSVLGFSTPIIQSQKANLLTSYHRIIRVFIKRINNIFIQVHSSLSKNELDQLNKIFPRIFNTLEAMDMVLYTINSLELIVKEVRHFQNQIRGYFLEVLELQLNQYRQLIFQEFTDVIENVFDKKIDEINSCSKHEIINQNLYSYISKIENPKGRSSSNDKFIQ